MGKEHTQKLGELLVNFNYITDNQLQQAINKQSSSNKRLGELLVELGYIDETDLIQVLEFQLGIPHARLSNYILTPQLAQYIPEHIARRYNVVAVSKQGDSLKVAMTDPSDLVAIDDIEMTSGLKVDPLIATSREVKKAINQIYSLSDEDTEEIFANFDESGDSDEPELDKLKAMVEDAPIVRLTNLIITQAIQMRASDIHIEPQAKKIRVRFRIDGVLREQLTAPKNTQAALISRLKIIANMDITKRRIPQDGRVEMNIKGVRVDMRVSTLPTIYGEKVVIRLLTKDHTLINIDNLGFSKENLNRFKKLIDIPHGILLVTGPTGSGKSTTLFATLSYLNSPEKNIITIEDPVEYQLDGINQVQANQKTGLTFARTLRSILRQDPDIVMVGEIRDEETARIAVRAALTGHLVLSTLHTNDAVSSITRLIDMGIPPYLVASTVIGTVAQRLVRQLCDYCKEEYEPGIEELQMFSGYHIDKLYRPRSCKRCDNMGYHGRVAIQEVLVIDEDIKELIVRNPNEQELKKIAIKKGMKTLFQDGIMKVKNGITSYEELVKIVV